MSTSLLKTPNYKSIKPPDQRMKRVLFYMGKGSSTSKQRNPDSDSSSFKMKWSFFPGNDASNTKTIAAGPNPDGATGSKDEAFFDSQAWLESDSEDFYSVQGESCTPSLKGSPVHQKKSLSDLFCESFDRTRHIDQSIFSDQRQENPNEGSPNSASRVKGRKSPSGSGRHCFPGLVRSLSCREWRKKRLSPMHVA